MILEMWEPVFAKRSCSNKKLERCRDSVSRDSAPVVWPRPVCRSEYSKTKMQTPGARPGVYLRLRRNTPQAAKPLVVVAIVAAIVGVIVVVPAVILAIRPPAANLYHVRTRIARRIPQRGDRGGRSGNCAEHGAGCNDSDSCKTNRLHLFSSVSVHRIAASAESASLRHNSAFRRQNKGKPVKIIRNTKI
jgi:hypothetical protein